MNAYELILEGYIAAKSNMNIVQIGANDGKINDPIYNFVRTHEYKTHILLVEPQTELIEVLKSNYSYHKSAKIYNGAIGSVEYLSLFRVRPELWDSYVPTYLKDAPSYRVPSGFTSYSIQHVYNHARGNLRTHLPLEQCVEEIRVPCRTLSALISELDWMTEIDLLQIDTEGADDTTIVSCNISDIKPKLINYEFTHLSRERNARLEQFLLGEGYKLLRWSNSDIIAVLDSQRNR